jgi:uncharacterized membrane protein
VHVLAAIIWVGGSITANILGTRAKRTGGTRLADFAIDTEWIGTRIYAPASLTVLVFGVLTTLKGGYSFAQEWLIIGIVGIVATAITGSVFIGPELKRIGGIIRERGPSDPEAAQRMSQLVVISRIDLVVLLIVVAAMVFKPGL